MILQFGKIYKIFFGGILQYFVRNIIGTFRFFLLDVFIGIVNKHSETESVPPKSRPHIGHINHHG